MGYRKSGKPQASHIGYIIKVHLSRATSLSTSSDKKIPDTEKPFPAPLAAHTPEKHAAKFKDTFSKSDEISKPHPTAAGAASHFWNFSSRDYLEEKAIVCRLSRDDEALHRYNVALNDDDGALYLVERRYHNVKHLLHRLVVIARGKTGAQLYALQSRLTLSTHLGEARLIERQKLIEEILQLSIQDSVLLSSVALKEFLDLP